MTDEPSLMDELRQFLSLERDVLILSLAMFGFSLGFQMIGRYVPRYLSVLGAGAVVIGAYKTLGDAISALYPYPGGWLSDRIGNRRALTLFGLVTTIGFLFWILAPRIGALDLVVVTLPAWIWIFVGLFMTQTWKSMGLGATFALVKQSVEPEKLATGFASTETFRRSAFLIAPLLAAAILSTTTDVLAGFQVMLWIAFGLAIIATVVQHRLYTGKDSLGKSFEGLGQIIADLRGMPDEIRPLLVADTFVRFANGMAYSFFIIVVTEFLQADATIFNYYLNPDALFGVLLGIEMLVALLVMIPAAYIARRVGLKPVVAAGFLVYAIFPIILINTPDSPWLLAAVFAFSGLRFAGLPSHKALIVGPAEEKSGGRVTGTYYVIRNTLTIPAGIIGGLLYSIQPELAFGAATVVGLLGLGYFLLRGKEFGPYAH